MPVQDALSEKIGIYWQHHAGILIGSWKAMHHLAPSCRLLQNAWPGDLLPAFALTAEAPGKNAGLIAYVRAP